MSLLVVIALVGLFNIQSEAHHSHAAAYRLNETYAIDGMVVKVAFREPHSFLHIEGLDQDGVMRRWSAEWADAGDLARHGVTRGTLRAGDQVRVVGRPGRNEETYQVLIARITRPSDGWSWSSHLPD